MDIKNLILQNRSIRTFDSSCQIKNSELYEMIDCARLSASSANKQPLKFRLVNNPCECKKTLIYTKWAAALPDMKLPPDGCEPSAYILILHDNSLIKFSSMFLKDVGIAAQSITLSACEMGYSCCMIGSFDNKEIKSELNIPEYMDIELIIAIGKAKEEVKIITAENSSTTYYRDENGVHIVPKRPLEEIIIK